jgi:hypothetical protein
MANMAVLKVKIGKNNQGFADYPNFNTLAVVVAAGMDWSKYIDSEGSGWLYDADGHDADTVDSPRGQQWGLLLVPETFATEAVAAFPTLCTRLNDTDAMIFYEKQHARDFEEEDIDETILTRIKRKQDFGKSLTRADKRALDKRSQNRGIRKNRRKKFKEFKADRGFDVIDP